MLYNQFGPYPGRTIIMDGRVWHGVYPCKAPRRSFVVDFDFEYYKPNEVIPGMQMQLNPDVSPNWPKEVIKERIPTTSRINGTH